MGDNGMTILQRPAVANLTVTRITARAFYNNSASLSTSLSLDLNYQPITINTGYSTVSVFRNYLQNQSLDFDFPAVTVTASPPQ
jgi:hypothetical protein